MSEVDFSFTEHFDFLSTYKVSRFGVLANSEEGTTDILLPLKLLNKHEINEVLLAKVITSVTNKLTTLMLCNQEFNYSKVFYKSCSKLSKISWSFSREQIIKAFTNHHILWLPSLIIVLLFEMSLTYFYLLASQLDSFWQFGPVIELNGPCLSKLYFHVH